MRFYRSFDNMTWPDPNSDRFAELAWRLRYGVLTKSDMLLAASVLCAYGELINKTIKRRNYVVKKLKEK